MVEAALGQRLGLNSRTPGTQHSSSGAAIDSDISSGGGGGLAHCRLLNITVCAPTVAASRAGTGFSVALYNPLAWRRTHHIRIPIAGDHSWTVTGDISSALILHC